MIHFRLTETARFHFTETVKLNDGTSNTFDMYTSTWDEAKQVLQRNWQRWLATNHDTCFLLSVAGKLNNDLTKLPRSHIGINVKHVVAVATFVGGDAELTIERIK